MIVLRQCCQALFELANDLRILLDIMCFPEGAVEAVAVDEILSS